MSNPERQRSRSRSRSLQRTEKPKKNSSSSKQPQKKKKVSYEQAPSNYVAGVPKAPKHPANLDPIACQHYDLLHDPGCRDIIAPGNITDNYSAYYAKQEIQVPRDPSGKYLVTAYPRFVKTVDYTAGTAYVGNVYVSGTATNPTSIQKFSFTPNTAIHWHEPLRVPQYCLYSLPNNFVGGSPGYSFTINQNLAANVVQLRLTGTGFIGHETSVIWTVYNRTTTVSTPSSGTLQSTGILTLTYPVAITAGDILDIKVGVTSAVSATFPLNLELACVTLGTTFNWANEYVMCRTVPIEAIPRTSTRGIVPYMSSTLEYVGNSLLDGGTVAVARVPGMTNPWHNPYANYFQFLAACPKQSYDGKAKWGAHQMMLFESTQDYIPAPIADLRFELPFIQFSGTVSIDEAAPTPFLLHLHLGVVHFGVNPELTWLTPDYSPLWEKVLYLSQVENTASCNPEHLERIKALMKNARKFLTNPDTWVTGAKYAATVASALGKIGAVAML